MKSREGASCRRGRSTNWCDAPRPPSSSCGFYVPERPRWSEGPPQVGDCGVRALSTAWTWVALVGGLLSATTSAFAAPLPAPSAEKRAEQGRITIGSKAFPESWILGDAPGARRDLGVDTTVHRKNLGGTEIAYKAPLARGTSTRTPEYTGTVAEVILKTKDHPTDEEMRQALAPLGIGMSAPLGFRDNYAIAVTQRAHAEFALNKISDLAAHPDLRDRFHHEFLGREDGWPGLARSSRDERGARGSARAASGALAKGELDATKMYHHDPQIEELSLFLLDDDLAFFPRYDAIFLYRMDLSDARAEHRGHWSELEGELDEGAMMRANAAVISKKHPTDEAAHALIAGLVAPPSSHPSSTGRAVIEISHNVAQHLRLVGISLFMAILFGVPLGVLAARSRTLAVIALALAGLIRTLPSLALLAFLIPLFGIGALPALVALFLYSLLPIVRNTFTGLTQIPTALDEAADAIGLPPFAKLMRVRLPLASPAITSGIKTSAVINVGTATLAALIGAEGLRETRFCKGSRCATPG